MAEYFYHFNLIDPGEVLPFKVNSRRANRRNKEDRKAKEFLRSLRGDFEKKKLPLRYLGEDSQNHILKFIADDGYIEFFLSPPISIQGYFVSNKADKYLKVLKKGLKDRIKDDNLRFILDATEVEKKRSIMAEQDWKTINLLYAKKSIVYVSMGAVIFGMFEGIGKLVEENVISYFGLHEISSVILFAIKLGITILVLYFFLEPAREKLEHYLEKILR